jgi:cell division protein FtsI/penicillin-binding protein 2
MATHPNFDPNRPGLAETAHRRNRVITDIFEPGSTFKIVVVAAALNEGVVTLRDRFNCEQGAFYYGGAVLHDHDAYGILSVEKIITKSSNIGAAKVGIRLGPKNLYDYMKRFGFGERTGIPLPGEQVGIVRPLEKWRKISITRIPMGHEIAATPLQMAMAMSAIANEGRMMRPMLVDRLLDEEGKTVAQYAPQQTRQVIQPETARHMVTALKTVVSTNGTARKADLEHYEVAGKTGTAQKAGRGDNLNGKYIDSFIGFFPNDNTAICSSVVMDEPQHGYYGGQTSAPIFRNIARLASVYLDIPPELGPQETMAARGPGGPAGGGLTPRRSD